MSRGREAQIAMPVDEYEGPPPSKCVKFLYYTWKFCSVIFSHFIMICLVIAYSILGAFTFHWLEAEHERKIKESIAWIRGNVTQDIWIMTNYSDVLKQENWTTDVSVKLKAFENRILQAMKHDGWDGIENPDSIQWTFTGALFYSIIVITTIGYGHIAPKTQTGKVVTIFYAILGIPLMLLCLSNIGDVMASSFRFLYWRVCCYVCTRPPKKRRRHRQLSRHPSTHRSVRGRGTSTRRRARPLSTLMPATLEPHSYSDTECRYRDSGYATAPGSAKPKRPPLARVRSQPPPTQQNIGKGLKRARSFQTEAEADADRSPASYSRNARDRFVDDRHGIEDDFPKISLPLKDLQAALYDLERHGRSHTGDFNSKSLPRPPRNQKDRRRKYDPYDYPERSEMHNLRDIDYDNFRERQTRMRKHQEDYEDREYDYDPDDDFDLDRARRRQHNERFNRGQSEYYDRRADFEYPDYCEPDRRRARSMMYETERRYDDDMPPKRQFRRLDTREDSRKPYRYSISPEPRARGEVHMRRREPVEEDWSDDDQDVDPDFLFQARRKDRHVLSSRPSELQLQGMEPAYKPQIKPVPIWLCVCLVVSYIIAGTFLFNKWESWPFLDSAYFCFITLTTIGFGDFVPAQGIESDQAAESIALCSLYLLFGISLLAMSFNLVQEEVISNVKAVAKKLGIIKSDGEESDSE